MKKQWEPPVRGKQTIVPHERQGFQANTYDGKVWRIGFSKTYKGAEELLREQLKAIEAS